MRKKRKGDPPLTEAQRHMNLAVALLRVDAAVEALNAVPAPRISREWAIQLKQQLMTQRVGAEGRWFAYLQFYFASVHVLLRTWQRGGFQNPTVEKLLGDAHKVAMLTDFRDDLMHGGAFLGDEAAVFFEHMREIDAWALQLRKACETHVVTFFATPRTN